MGRPGEYSSELRERAMRMVLDARKDPASARGAIVRIGKQLEVHPEALRSWLRKAEVDGGLRQGTTSDDVERLAVLERENRELRRANTVLRQAAAYFAQVELDRPYR